VEGGCAGVTEPEEAYGWPKDRKQGPVPVVGSDGMIRPAASRSARGLQGARFFLGVGCRGDRGEDRP